MLLGNKVDLPNKEVTYDMGAEYAKSKGWGFLEVSAKQDTNIRQAFFNLVSGLNQIHNTEAVPLGGNSREGDTASKSNQFGLTRE